MKNKDNITIVVLFVAVILFLSIGTIFAKDKSFSDNENRYLQETPKFSVDNVISGTYEKNFENYVNDQFLFRENWIQIKTKAKLAMFSKDVAGVYLCKDDYYIEKITAQDVDQELYKKNVNEIKTFFDSLLKNIPEKNMSFMPVPTASLILKDKLPRFASPFDENSAIDYGKAQLEKYNVVDLREKLMEANDQYIYYKTDHHWTTKGAEIAYEQWSHSNDSLKNKDKVTLKKATDKFRGTLYSKVLLNNSAYDEIDIYQDDTKYNVMADGKKLKGIYDYSALEKKDKYAVFLGGNYGNVEITGGVKNGKTLLLIKDSFANSFVPYIAKDYEKIVMVDLRYFRGNMTDYVKKNQVTDVLVLYNMANLISDKNLTSLNSQWGILQ
ncbi:MAG: DHHW family protein [Anaerovoracaceae bacterium]